jgi:hypothetical protein
MPERYCTLSELRTQIDKDGTSGAGGDAALNLIIDGVSRAIDQHCNRPDGFVAAAAGTARYYVGSGGHVQFIDECVAVSAVAVKDSVSDDEDGYTAWTVGTVGTTTSADVFPASGSERFPNWMRTPYTMLVIGANGDYSVFTGGEYSGRAGFSRDRSSVRGVPTVEVTARWGYAATVPAGIRQACITESARLFKRGEAAWADALTQNEFGVLRYVQEFDPVTRIMLARFGKPAVGFPGGG